jgi:chemotaxis protein MotB
VARKKEHAGHVNHERWMVSYADFVTLLFAFFVVMFATSQTDKAKVQQVSDSVNEALSKGGVAAAVHEILGGTVDERGKGNAQMKGPGGSNASKVPNPTKVAELLPSMHYLTKELEQDIRDGKIELHIEPRGLVISLRQATFFPSGGEAMDPATYSSIEKIAGTIRDLPNPVRLEGHTDSVPIHTTRFRSNWELSAARAITMMDLLADQYGIPQARMAIGGYGDSSPIETNDTAEGRAHNRRVDIVILSQKALMSEPVSASAANSAGETTKPGSPAPAPPPAASTAAPAPPPAHPAASAAPSAAHSAAHSGAPLAAHSAAPLAAPSAAKK